MWSGCDGNIQVSRHLPKTLFCWKQGFEKLFSCLDETLFSKKTDFVTYRTSELIIIRKEEFTGDAEVIEDISDFISKIKVIPNIIRHID